MPQTGGVAGAVDPDDGPGASGTALAGAGRGHPLAGQRRQRPGRRPTTREPRAARPPAALGPARGGPAPAHAPIATGLALGPGVPDDRPALAPSLAVGAGALARHPSMRGAVASVVAC